MKTLLLLRHAKSSWDDSSVDDFERPLNRRGERAADAMGALLARAEPVDRVLCSPAVRTRQTLERITRHLSEPPDVRTPPDLYLASADTLLAAVRSVDPDVARLLVIAHNPGIHALALALAGPVGSNDRDRMRAKYPTGALAELHGAVERWGKIVPETLELVRFVRPRDLESP